MKSNKTLWFLFAVTAALFLSAFFLLPGYLEAKKEIAKIEGIDSAATNFAYYVKTAQRLGKEYGQVTNRNENRLTASDFISRLPSFASGSGIRNISVENLGALKENNRDVSELRISLLADFYQTVSFLSYLENGRLPVQIKNISMALENNRVRSQFTVRFYDSMPMEVRETHGSL